MYKKNCRLCVRRLSPSFLPFSLPADPSSFSSATLFCELLPSIPLLFSCAHTVTLYVRTPSCNTAPQFNRASHRRQIVSLGLKSNFQVYRKVCLDTTLEIRASRPCRPFSLSFLCSFRRPVGPFSQRVSGRKGKGKRRRRSRKRREP